MDLKTVSALLARHQADLRQRGVKSLVEFDRPVGLFEFIHLKLYLEELTGRRVDLVTPDALRPGMRAAILNEAVHVA